MTTVEIEGKTRPQCPVCGYTIYEDPKVAVAVLIERDGRVLLGRRTMNPGKGRWSFPCGFVDRGEVVQEAAQREVREETGLEVQLGPLVGLYSHRGNPVILAVYSGKAVDGQPEPGDDLDQLGWYYPDGLPELAFEHDPEIIADWWQQRQHASD